MHVYAPALLLFFILNLHSSDGALRFYHFLIHQFDFYFFVAIVFVIGLFEFNDIGGVYFENGANVQPVAIGAARWRPAKLHPLPIDGVRPVSERIHGAQTLLTIGNYDSIQCIRESTTCSVNEMTSCKYHAGNSGRFGGWLSSVRVES